MVWRCACSLDIIVRLFLSLFPHCELSHFSLSIYRQWVPREHNSSYNFILIFLELCTCFLHVWRCAYAFHIILAIFFVTFFCTFLNFVLYWLFWNFACVFFMVWECACGLDVIVRLFLSLFPHCELSHFSPFIYKQLVPFVSATPLTVLYRLLWNFACIFFMVWGCACGLDVIVRLFFLLFPTLWT